MNLYFPTIMSGGAADDTDTQDDVRPRPPVQIPTGFGMGIPWQLEIDVPTWLARLHNPHWYDWHWAGACGEKYQHMIYSSVPKGGDWGIIQQLIKRDPSHLWLVLNEPERRDQANMDGEAGAAVAWQMAKAGAYIAVPGVIITDIGLGWLDDYLEAGGPIPSAWHVHLYYASNAAEVDLRLTMWHDWMKSHDLVLPTIISETNAHSASIDCQIDVMTRLAQQLLDIEWLSAIYWFSLHYDTGNPVTLTNDLIEDVQVDGDHEAKLGPVAQLFFALQGLDFS